MLVELEEPRGLKGNQVLKVTVLAGALPLLLMLPRMTEPLGFKCIQVSSLDCTPLLLLTLPLLLAQVLLLLTLAMFLREAGVLLELLYPEGRPAGPLVLLATSLEALINSVGSPMARKHAHSAYAVLQDPRRTPSPACAALCQPLQLAPVPPCLRRLPLTSTCICSLTVMPRTSVSLGGKCRSSVSLTVQKRTGTKPPRWRFQPGMISPAALRSATAQWRQHRAACHPLDGGSVRSATAVLRRSPHSSVRQWMRVMLSMWPTFLQTSCMTSMMHSCLRLPMSDSYMQPAVHP